MKKFKFLTMLLCITVLITLIGCSKKSYTVTFEVNGGSSIEDIVVLEGEHLQEVTSTKQGYTLKGWGIDKDFSKLWDFTNDVVTDNMTLYALWEKVNNDPITYTITFNTNGGTQLNSITVNAGESATAPNNPTKEGFTFDNWYTDEELTQVYVWTTKVSTNITLYANWIETKSYTATLVFGNGSENSTIAAENNDGKFYIAKPQDPKKDYCDFSHWSLTDGGDEYDFSSEVTENIILYAVYTAKYDTVTSSINGETILKFASMINPDLPSQVTITETKKFGKFEIEGGSTRFEIKTDTSKNVLNTQGKSIKFTLSGEGTNNSIYIKGTGASSSSENAVKITNLDTGEVIKEWAEIGNKVEFDGLIENLPAGNYEYTNLKSIRISELTLTEKLPQGPVQGLELNTSNTKINFLLGKDFDSTGLTASLIYENGRVDEIDLSDLVIMTDQFDTVGKKNVYVAYNNFEAQYTVNVCEAESIKLYTYTLDSKRITKNLQQVFALNSTFNTDNLVVKANCAIPESENYIEFILSNDDYKLSTPDMTTTGKKTITISYGSLSANYDIQVVNLINTDSLTTCQVIIDNTINEAIITNNVMMFPSINQGLQYLELLKLSEEVKKNIILTASQTYFEKVEITLPNTIITTCELQNTTYIPVTDSNKLATIEYNVLAGDLDASESVMHSTDGSATVSIRETAYDSCFFAVRFKNYYNTYELYQASKLLTNDTQAVACLVQADRITFKDCEFTSYHDTLYVQKGRHYFLDCKIEGKTDYIFGYDSTTVFKNCEIKSLGAGLTEKNGGYIVATKGNPSGGKNIIYGIIFDGCTLIGDENVQLGSVSIARGWDSGMTLMVMNSNISGHFSKEAYNGNESELNDRYTKMNAAPVASQIFEYNNTGDGAINSSIENTCTYASSTTAALYESLIDIFTPNNGTTTYDISWQPLQERNAVINFVDNSGSTIYTSNNETYYGSVLTSVQISNILNSITVSDGKQIEGLYLDSTFTIKLDCNQIINEGTIIYVNITSSSNKTDYVLSVPESGKSWSEYTALDTDGIFYATNGIKTEGLKIDGANYKADGLTFTSQFSLTSGKVQLSDGLIKNGIRLVLDTEATIIIYAAQKHDKNTRLKVMDASGSEVTVNNLLINGVSSSKFDTLSKTEVVKYEFTLSAGEYGIGGESGGVYVYGMTVTK